MGLFDNVNKAVAGQQSLNEDLTGMNIQMQVITEESNLNVRKGPGTDYEIIGKAAHNSNVQLLKRADEKWYLVRTADGVEGYCSKYYLKQL